MKTLKLKIIGTVQGVFFRKFVEDSAEELSLKGFVRNLDDGNVEIVVEGDNDKVNELLRRCEEGPPHSDIKSIEKEEMNHQGFDSFKRLSV